MNDYLVFDGVSTADYGIAVFPKEIDNAPKRDIDKIKVPGRNGTLIIDNGRYEDVSQTYTGIIFDNEKFDEYMNVVRAYILGFPGYKRLEDSFKPDEYRMAYVDSDFSPDVIRLWRKMGKFELKFTCKPQRFLKLGEKSNNFTTTGYLYNPSIYPAQPYIRVYGYGQFFIEDFGVTVAQHSRPYIDIDCERMDAFYNAVNCNGLIALTSDFPVLWEGASEILMAQTITRLQIVPNWWIL